MAVPLTGWLDAIPLRLYQMFRHTLPSMWELETASEDGRNLLSIRGDLLTVIRLHGLRYALTNEEIRQSSARIRAMMKPALSHPSRSIQFLFLCDPDRTPLYLATHLAAVRNYAAAIELSVGTLLDERETLWNACMCVEESLVSLWTRRSMFNAGEQKIEAAKQESGRKTMRLARDAQKTWLRSALLTARHEGMVSQFRLALKREGVGTTRLDARDALIEMRKIFDPSRPRSNWRPRLPDDMPSVMRPDTDPQGDVSHMLNPPLAKQFFQTAPERVGFSQVDMGRYRYAPVDMTVPPEKVKGFAELYEALRRPHIPFRVSFLLDGGGGRWMGLRKGAASALAVLSHTNKRIATALEELARRQEAGETFVRLRCSAATWGPASNPDDVHTRSAKLESGLQGWGAAQTSIVAGDPVEAMMSSTLGLHALSTAPGANARLDDVLFMMPWTRQGSPWQEGSMLFMTPEGRPAKYDPIITKRRAVVRIFVGPPGTGKSVLMNSVNLGLILSAVAIVGESADLPYVRVIDVGPSAKGVTDMIREALPPRLAHLVLHARMQNADQYAYNIFDTQPGCRYPLPFERESIINIIASKCRREDGRSYESISSMIGAALDEVYKYRSDDYGDSQPYTYQRRIEPLVDEAIARHGLAATERDSWWNVVDALHDAGETHAMTLAQRHAVPLLHDLITVAGQSYIADIYEKTRSSDTSENYLQLFNRLITEMINDLPILSKPTQFDLGEARVVVLDMQELCRPGGAQATMRTQIMYLVASHILARDFMLKEDHLAHIPPRYKAYNGTRIRQFSTRMKALSLDEKHVTRDCPQIEDQIDLLARTGRKDTFQLNLASQLLADYPPRIAGLATEIFITGLNQGETAREAADRFSLSAGSLDHIENGRLSGPHRLNELSSVYAAPFLAVWRLDDMAAGGKQAEQLLYNVIGPREMWALSTRPDDVHLRDQLYRILSSQEEAWRRLARVFPNGTAREAIEKRTTELAGRGRNKGDARQAVIGGLIQDICDGTGIALGVGRAADRDINPLLAREQRAVLQALIDPA